MLERTEARPGPGVKMRPPLRTLQRLPSPACASPSGISVLSVQEHDVGSWVPCWTAQGEAFASSQKVLLDGDSQEGHREVSVHFSTCNLSPWLPARNPVSLRLLRFFSSPFLSLFSGPLNGAGCGEQSHGDASRVKIIAQTCTRMLRLGAGVPLAGAAHV